MSEFICPATKRQCHHSKVCSFVNEPLDQAVPHIRQKVNGYRWKYVAESLRRAIATQAGLWGVDLPFNIDDDGNARVCPEHLIDGETAARIGQNAVAQSMHNRFEACVGYVITDINAVKSRQASS